MKVVLTKLFGENWRTTILGWLKAIAMAIFAYVLGALTNNEAVTWSGIAIAVLNVIKGYLDTDNANVPSPTVPKEGQDNATPKTEG